MVCLRQFEGEHRKAIYLFQAASCSPCGTILFRRNPIWAKRMRRLVSVCVFYIVGGGYIADRKEGNAWLLLSSLCISCLNCVCKRDQNVPALMALIFCKFSICDKRNQESTRILLQTLWHLMKAQII